MTQGHQTNSKQSHRPISSEQPCFLIAEIGINHNGDLDLALKSIEAARKCGVDAVKFQNYVTDDFLSDHRLTYEYPGPNGPIVESQYDLFKRNELTDQQFRILKNCCDTLDVEFLSTPTSERGVDFLSSLGCKKVKNGSDYLVNHRLVAAMARSGMDTILSTGMATMAEIDGAVSTFRASGGRDPILLHCTSTYPTSASDLNLRRIPVLAQAFGCFSGFSDHSEGITAATVATVLGANVIEKHFTLDRSLPGPDHSFSSDPAELSQLVNAIRYTESSLGTTKLGPTEAEEASRESFRLSCVAAESIEKGTILTASHIAFRRPGVGLAPDMETVLIGRTTNVMLKKGDVFTWSHLQ
jgi:N-acetylneuraminate synthase/N,N'-diacetyllegionaminate synthase